MPPRAMSLNSSTLEPNINPLKTKPICFIYGLSAYSAVNTFHLGDKNQFLDVVWGKSFCLFWDPY
jgi:hypothetical protein